MYVNGKMDMQACLENSKILLENLQACKSDADRCKLTAELLKEELGAYNKSEADKAEYIKGVIENFFEQGG